MDVCVLSDGVLPGRAEQRDSGGWGRPPEALPHRPLAPAPAGAVLLHLPAHGHILGK